MSFRHAALGFILIVSPGAAMAGPNQDLAALIAAASPGDVIRTKPADFGAVEINNVSFNPPVTIEFHKNSVVRRALMRNVSGLIFDGMNVESGVAANPISDNNFFVLGGANLTFRNSSFVGEIDDDALNDGSALVLDGVDGITIEASVFDHVRRGVIIRSSSNAVIAGSTFSNIFADGMAISGTSNLEIRDNTCRDFRTGDAPDPHRDCVQLLAGSRAVANSNVLITGNTALKGDGVRAQGIFVKSVHIGAPHVNVTIENNYIKQDVGLGIAGENVSGLTIRNNQVLPSFEAAKNPRIFVRDPTENVLIEGNTAWRIQAPAHATLIDNIELADQ